MICPVLSLRLTRWLARAAISGLLVSAWAVADAHRSAAAGGVDFTPNASSLDNRDASSAEGNRLLARIREAGRRDGAPACVVVADRDGEAAAEVAAGILRCWSRARLSSQEASGSAPREISASRCSRASAGRPTWSSARA